MVHGQLRFPTRNRWGIFDLLPQEFGLEVLHLPLYAYGSRHRTGVCHFFLMDRQFESVWRRADVGLRAVQRFDVVCTPDFSLYRDRPPAEQLYNVYRNRWCGRFWQSRGLHVVPTIRWSTPASYPFCFLGVPPRQIVATGTPDLRDPVARKLFARGLEKVFEILEPRGLILFGVPSKDFPIRKLVPRNCKLALHPHRWQQLRRTLTGREQPKRTSK